MGGQTWPREGLIFRNNGPWVCDSCLDKPGHVGLSEGGSFQSRVGHVGSSGAGFGGVHQSRATQDSVPKDEAGNKEYGPALRELLLFSC